MVRYEGSAGLDLMQLGKVLAGSGYFADTKDTAQAIVKVLAGQELGIGPIASMTGIYLVNGRVAIGANLMAAAVMRSGKYTYRVRKLDESVCEIAFFQGRDEIGVSTFTIADAKKAQTKNIDRFPRNMLFARAMSNGVRWYCPDVFSTAVYTPEELGDDAVSPLPAAPAASSTTGEVIDEQLVVRGAVRAAPNSKYDAAGNLHLTLKVGGYNFLIKNAAPELAFIEAGDEVAISYHAETIKGKQYNVVDTIIGPKNADGLTAWEQRESESRPVEEAEDGATFEAVEEPAL